MFVATEAALFSPASARALVLTLLIAPVVVLPDVCFVDLLGSEGAARAVVDLELAAARLVVLAVVNVDRLTGDFVALGAVTRGAGLAVIELDVLLSAGLAELVDVAARAVLIVVAGLVGTPLVDATEAVAGRLEVVVVGRLAALDGGPEVLELTIVGLGVALAFVVRDGTLLVGVV